MKKKKAFIFYSLFFFGTKYALINSDISIFLAENDILLAVLFFSNSLYSFNKKY